MTYRSTRPADRSARSRVREQLDRILGSGDFDASKRSQEFLRFIVDETLAGRGEQLTQGSIAVKVFNRKDDFDPLLDPIVRIQAGRLRRSLERYYLLAGKGDSVVIDVPRGAYLPVFRPGSEAPGAEVPAEVEASLAPVAVEWPSVLVRGFEAPTGEENEETAVRLTEELTLELCRYREVRVLLRREDGEAGWGGASPTFELRGRVRRVGDTTQIVAGLVDRRTGEQVWGDEYQPEEGAPALDDVARVIAARVGAEHGVIVQALKGRYHLGPSRPGGAYGALLRSHLFFFARDLAEYPEAVASLQHTVAEHPEIALAWSYLARLYMVNHSFELTRLLTPIDDAISCADQAVRLDPTSSRARCLLGSTLLVKGEREAARNEAREALRFNPSSLVYLEIIGFVLALSGEWDEGISLVRSAVQRNPHHLPHAHYALWAGHMERGEFPEASTVALEHRDPMFFWRSLMRASALGQLGRTEEAEARAAELLREKPDFGERGRVLIGHYLKAQSLQDTVIDGLKKAGLTLR